jgi:hypothetical protein
LWVPTVLAIRARRNCLRCSSSLIGVVTVPTTAMASSSISFFFARLFARLSCAAEPQFSETGACIKPMAIRLPTRARQAPSKKFPDL